MKPPAITLENILQLEPASLRMEIPLTWADSNGHMNMRWYVAIFDDAGEPLNHQLGLSPEARAPYYAGTFDLEHHTHFLKEAIPGDRVSVYTRMTGCSAKRMTYLMFLVNESRNELSAIFECVNGLVDLEARKTRPYPKEIFESIEAAVIRHSKLTWPAPVCGVMSA